MAVASADIPVGKQRVLSTLNDDGSRRWLRPRLSPGRFLTRRRGLAYFLILVFTAIPYIQLNGKPLILLDLVARRFTLFGRTFLPTDTLLLALLLVGVFVLIFLLTAFFGRVWCGWACPQTVYMEFVFRPLERLFGGAPGRAKKGWLAGKAYSKPLRFFVSLVICVYLAHTFLAYFVGVENLRIWMTRSPLDHPIPFLVMLAVTGLMLLDFGFFREQVCIILCPYGRLQSALLDRNSLIVGYDKRRGEPRGHAKRPSGDVALTVLSGHDEARTGDCVDCGMCVTTCPTGIDIRDGLQMECINCTQCIDACDSVMTKLKRPRGLIRYSSQAEIANEKTRILRPRVIIYPAILLVIISAFFVVLSGIGSAHVTILRGVGRPFVELPGGEIGNPVKIKIINRSETHGDFRVELTGAEGLHLTIEENPIKLAPGESRTFPAMIAAPAPVVHQADPRITVSITRVNAKPGEPEFHEDVSFRLMGPGGNTAHSSAHDRDDDSRAPHTEKED